MKFELILVSKSVGTIFVNVFGQDVMLSVLSRHFPLFDCLYTYIYILLLLKCYSRCGSTQRRECFASCANEVVAECQSAYTECQQDCRNVTALWTAYQIQLYQPEDPEVQV